MAGRAVLTGANTRIRRVVNMLVFVLACAPRAAIGETPPADSGPRVPGIVLREVHTSSGVLEADTLVTILTPGRMLVIYGDVHTILDVTGNRFALLETATATYRSIPFTEWEKEVRWSLEGQGPPDTLRFEPMGGEAVPIAGQPCWRYHVYARHEVYPGEFVSIEQEIWVTRDLALAPGAVATSRRVQESLDWIGFDAPVVRPEGVALRTTIRRRPEGAGMSADEFEVNEAITVDRLDVPAAWFEIPAGYTRVQDEAMDPGAEPAPADTSQPR